jgi:hypothetical protein
MFKGTEIVGNRLPSTSHNNAYNAAPEYRLGLRHIAAKDRRNVV